MIESIPYVLTGIGIIISILYYTSVLRNANKTQQIQLDTRKAQLFTSVWEKVYTEQAMDGDLDLMNIQFKTAQDWEELLKNREKYKAWNWWGGYFEGMGLLVRDDFVDIDMVARLMSGSILSFWTKYKDGIMACRESNGWPRFMIEFEYLAIRVIEHGKENPELQITDPSLY